MMAIAYNISHIVYNNNMYVGVCVVLIKCTLRTTMTTTHDHSGGGGGGSSGVGFGV